MSLFAVHIGQRIRNYRIQKEWSQEELAEKCGLHSTYIGQIERGEKNATIESISKIARGLSLPLSVLFENLEEYNDDSPNYPSMAYDLVQSVPKHIQEKLITVLKIAIEIKEC